MPHYNTEFLRQFLLVNEGLLTDEHVLLKDCHWAPFHYSIEGTPLKGENSQTLQRFESMLIQQTLIPQTLSEVIFSVPRLTFLILQRLLSMLCRSLGYQML